MTLSRTIGDFHALAHPPDNLPRQTRHLLNP